jgi:hypothetical protein
LRALRPARYPAASHGGHGGSIAMTMAYSMKMTVSIGR